MINLIFLIFCGTAAAKLDTIWWRHTSIYELLLHTFKDSNNDGIGDIKGLTSKLNHFVDLDIETIYISSLYNKVRKDGFSVTTDDYNINPYLGTIRDFEELLNEAKNKGLKIIIDLILNYSDHVRDKSEVKKVMKFWLDKGVNGFKIDSSWFYNMYSINEFKDKIPLQYINELRDFLDKYNTNHGGLERIFTTSRDWNNRPSSAYYGPKNYPLYHFSINYHFKSLYSHTNAVLMKKLISNDLNFTPKGEVIAWVVDGQEFSRTGTGICPEYTDILMIITSMLPGVVHYFYGTEIGLLDGYIRHEKQNSIADFFPVNPHTLLMQWDDSINSGFSRNWKTIFPTANNYYRKNVEIQKNDDKSYYNLMKDLNKLRKTKTIRDGKFYSHVYSSDVYVFWRSLWGNPTIVVVINFEDNQCEVDLKQIFTNLPDSVFVEASSTNTPYKKGQSIIIAEQRKIIMNPLSSVVLTGNNLYR